LERLGRLRESEVLDDSEFERENTPMLDCLRPHNRHRDASE
jgi:hypothetical protein